MTSQNHIENKLAEERYQIKLEKLKNKLSDVKPHPSAKHFPILLAMWERTTNPKVTNIPAHCPPLCIKCARPMDCLVVGAHVIATNHNQITTSLDLYECKECGAIVTNDYKRCL